MIILLYRLLPRLYLALWESFTDIKLVYRQPVLSRQVASWSVLVFRLEMKDFMHSTSYFYHVREFGVPLLVSDKLISSYIRILTEKETIVCRNSFFLITVLSVSEQACVICSKIFLCCLTPPPLPRPASQTTSLLLSPLLYLYTFQLVLVPFPHSTFYLIVFPSLFQIFFPPGKGGERYPLV